jgi:hypothetical protein
MTSHWVVAHVLSFAHGLAAALITVAAFYAMGFLLLPSRWQSTVRWTGNVVFGLTSYVLLCWVATTSRNIAVMYVALLFGAVLWGLGALRFQRLQRSFHISYTNRDLRTWVAGFSILYLTSYLLIRPPAGGAFLALPPDGAMDVVTYARYAKHLLTFGTATVEGASFEFLHSPASVYVLAWHSLLYLGDPLDAAMPLMFMVAALFGTIALELAYSTFGLSWRAGLAIAVIAVCAPMFRWTLATYSLGELLAATSVLYLISAFAGAAVARSINAARLVAIACGGVLLYFSGSALLRGPAGIARAVAEASRQFSLLGVLGVPNAIPPAGTVPDYLPSAALVVLPLVPVVWAMAGTALRRYPSIDQMMPSAIDRRLAAALVGYFAVAVIAGNVALQAVEGPREMRWPGAWRDLHQVGRMPFRAFTLRVADKVNGLSTALAMYYTPGKKIDVVGSEVSLDDLPFDTVSREQPMFIQSYRCEGVGHGDTVSVEGVGCLLLAPPSMTVGVSYPFNRTFLFLEFDRMTSRDPGGRWNTHSTLNLQLTADPQRAQLSRAMYINFLVNPFLPAGAKPERLNARWGTARRGGLFIGERQWFSLPVESGDWAGNRLWTVPVTIEIPGGRTMLFQEFALTESPRGEVVQRY